MRGERERKIFALIVLAIFVSTVFFGGIERCLKERDDSNAQERDFITNLEVPAINETFGNGGYEPWYYYIGDIVNTANGNLYISITDISIKAKGFKIEITRSYNSHWNDTNTAFGYGWTFNYNVYLVENASTGTVTLAEGDGSVHTFTQNGSYYDAPAGIHYNLTKNLDNTFLLRFKDGSKYNFDSSGRILNMVDRNNNHLNFTYTGGRLTGISDDSSLSLSINYNADGMISSVVDPQLSRQIFYRYDADGNLINVTDAMGNSTLYSYYDNHALKSIINRFGGVLTFEYENGRVSEVIASLYNYTTGTSSYHFRLYTIDYNNHIAVITDARGFDTIVQTNDAGNPIHIVDALGGVTTMKWDSDMNLISYTDANRHTYTFEYDGYGNIINQTDPSGHSVRYDWNNIHNATHYISLLVNITNTRGYTTSYSYDENGNLISKTNALGNKSYFFYDDEKFMIRAVDYRGNATNYTWDAHGNLVSVTDALGGVRRYEHDAVGRTTKIIDAENRTTTYEYDKNDRLIKVTDASGNVTRYFYNEEGSLVKEIDALGRVTEYSHNIVNRIEKVTDASGNETSYIYDTAGRLLSKIDVKGAAKITYDALGRVTSFTDALGHTENYTYDAVGNMLSRTDRRGFTTHYQYDELNRLTKITDALGHETLYKYDSEGNIIEITDANNYTTTYEYDALNRLIKIINPLGNETSYGYDANWNIVSKVDANGFLTYYEYDALNRLVKIVDARGNETLYSYDKVGNLLSIVDRNGHTTSYEYDVLNRRIEITDGLGNITKLRYDAVGNLISLTNPRGYTTTYEYDDLDRIIKITDATGNTTEYKYDALGNLIKETDENGYTYEYTYDALSQLIKIRDPLGRETRFEYDEAGNLKKFTDANGNAVSYEYDALGNLIKRTDALGYEIRYSYDAVGNLINIIDANNHSTSYTYDALNRLIEIKYPLGGKIEYEYDALGNLIKRRDANGNVTLYRYDELSRVVRTEYPDGSYVVFEYDATYNCIKVENHGGLGETTYMEYDALNRLKRVEVDYVLFSKNISYTYDGNGNIVSMTDPEGGITYYQYDALDRVVKITEPSNSTVTFQYDNAGRRIKTVYPNGVYTTYTYSATNDLLNITVRKSNGDIISSYSYSYDNVGNRLSVTTQGKTAYYEYDALYRLANVTYPNGSVVRYTYDAVGNRLSMLANGITNYTYDNDDRLLTSGSITYSYDSNGNLIYKSDGIINTSYGYDYENRLIKVALPNGSNITYQYAPNGDRLSITDINGTTYLFYNVNDVLMEFNETGDVKARYTHGPGIDEPVVMSRGNTEAYYHFDGLGSIVCLSDINENVVQSYQYDVFGAIVELNGSIESRYAFTGREYDFDTNLYYLRARYYDPEIGRFITKDPWGRMGSELNLYVYAQNDPVNLVDPFGKRWMRLDSKWYSDKKYDLDCIKQLYDNYVKAHRKINEAYQKLVDELNKKLNQMRDEARRRAETKTFLGILSTFAAVAVGTFVGTLTANPALGAIAGAAVSTAVTEIGEAVTGTGSVEVGDIANGIASATGDAITGSALSSVAEGGAISSPQLASALSKVATAVGATISIFMTAYSAKKEMDARLDAINNLAIELSKKLQKEMDALHEENWNKLVSDIEEQCKKRKKPEPVITPTSHSGVESGGYTGGTQSKPPGRGRVTVPGAVQTSGGSSGGGIEKNDVGVTTPSHIDPAPNVTIPIPATVKNKGFDTVSNVSVTLQIFRTNQSRSILLVVDESDGAHVYYENALIANNYSYDIVFVDTEYTPVYSDGNASTKDLKDYDVVIWECSDDRNGTLEDPAQPELEIYLDNGGCLFVGGEGIMYNWPQSNGTLMSDYMFADGYGTDTYSLNADGIPGTIGDRFSLSLSGGNGSSFEYYSSSIADVKPGGEVNFMFTCGIAGIQADTGSYKTVLFAFNFDSIANDSQRNRLMTEILGFLDCRYGGGPGAPIYTDTEETGTLPPQNETTVIFFPRFNAPGTYRGVVTVAPDVDDRDNTATTTIEVKANDTYIIGSNLFPECNVPLGNQSIYATIGNAFTNTSVNVSMSIDMLLSTALIDEGFESEIFPPPKWIVHNMGSNSSGETWFNAWNFSHSGWGSAAVLGGSPGEYQEEWLVTPVINLTDTEKPFLRFWFNLPYPNPNVTLYILAEIGESGEPENFTDFDVIYPAEDPRNFYSEPVIEELSAFEGKSIRLAFVYQAVNGSELHIDDVFIGGHRWFLQSYDEEGPIELSPCETTNVTFNTAFNMEGEYRATFELIHNTKIGNLSNDVYRVRFNVWNITDVRVIPESLSLEPVNFAEPPYETGVERTLSVVIENVGNINLTDIIVEAYMGKNLSEPLLIGTATVDLTGSWSLSDGESKTVTFEYIFLGEGAWSVWIQVNLTDDMNSSNDAVYENFTFEHKLTLLEGWNLASIPYILNDTVVENVLYSISGNYSVVWYYNAFDESDPWKMYNPTGVPWANDLTAINNTIGFWIKMLNRDVLLVNGTLPGTTTILLKEGWNMLGYPTLSKQSTPDALSSISGNYSIAWAYLANDTNDPWKLYSPQGPPWANDLTHLLPKFGYWIRATSDVTWTVG